jgi:hypothetical protein
MRVDFLFCFFSFPHFLKNHGFHITCEGELEFVGQTRPWKVSGTVLIVWGDLVGSC